MSRPDAAARLRRLLTVIPWILDHQGSTLEDIAARFGMKVTELERDLELIPFCGLPPYSPDRLIDCEIVHGAVYLRFAEYFARPLSLTPAEGFELLAAGRTLLAVPGADPGGSLGSALSKLAGVLGGPEGMAVELGPGRFLDPLRRAAEEAEQVEIDYYAFGRDALTTRRIDPRAVFAASGFWYVDAYCHLARDDRLFRVDRVRDVRPTGEHFDAPPREPRAGGGGLFHPRATDPRVTLVVPASASWVAETYPTENVETQPDGRLRIVLVVSERAWLERLLLRLGPAAEVTDPEEMCDVGAAAAHRLLARYRPGD
ncbi:MAG TPA: WYL domain-containing protein [Acidimicrobiia bacterium]|nr:WYL domain-containing protein [Acidimicrobiia bacterium]